MEKVKITKKQEEAMDLTPFDLIHDLYHGHYYYKGTHEEQEQDVLKVLKAYINGYEVEPEFKVGDWIYNTKAKRVAQIDHRFGNGDELWVDDEEFNFYHLNDSRHATPEEIKQEKERRFFNEHGRKPWELKVGDVLVKKMDNFPLVVTEVNAEEITLNLLTCTRSEVKKCCKVLCFADDRLDVSAE